MYKSTYIVKYNLFGKDNILIKENGEIYCHNRISEADAQVKLDEYFKKNILFLEDL